MPETKGNDTSSKDSPEKSFQIAAPTITMPKGGGAIRGMGEKFAANPVTGTGSMSVPIATSPGRSGFGPQLSLSYDSGAGNGLFGFGWNLSLPSITRKTDKGLPRYQDSEDSDVFILSGSEDLVPTLTKNAAGKWEPEVVPDRTVDGQVYRISRYRPRIEGLFARIERWTNQSDPTDVLWRSISKDNITTWYGKTAESRIQDPADPARIFSWLICQTHDDKGNVLVYGYNPEDSKNVDASQANERNRIDQFPSAQRYLKRIRYGNRAPYFPELKIGTAWPEPPGTADFDGSQHWLFEAVLDYGEHDLNTPLPEELTKAWTTRNDPFSAYRAGFEVRTYRLCQRVLMFHHFPGEAGVEANCLVRSTDFTYEYEQEPRNARVPIYSFLQSVTQSGYVRQSDQYLKKSLPPVEFTYSKPEVQDLVEEVDPESAENLPVGLDGAAYQWTDLHGEGIPGILSEQAGAWFYKRNLSPINVKPHDGVLHTEAKFSPVEVVAVKPNFALAGGQAQFMDLAGDGQPDLVAFEGPTPGLYEHDDAEGWEPFRPFTARLNRDTRDPNLKFVDLDGDGHADVLITEDEAFVWHESLAEEGFGPARRVVQPRDEEKGPRLVFADGTQSIHLADLSGDDLTDLVRIRNGEVCYWPNLGYGRFGAKVTMDNAPWFDHPDQFDQKRIRLADIDGSGTTDIIYLHRDGVRLYFNQSGNSWSQPHQLKVFPHVDDVVSIVPTDLLGNGTACLVWSSSLPGDARRLMRYVNLMGNHKPHLLVRTINNLGTETRVEYAPSTKFYLEDKRDGKPWSTKLPFPVHVVERVETYDHISRNRFVTRYTYHHGYFDGEEREFRGFGRVDQLDTEEFAALTGTSAFPVGDNIDETSHIPPVLTKSWFHTGAYLDRQRLEAYMSREYYQGDPQTTLLPDTIVPDQLSVDEEREACRALKGSMLRQEVYADDAGPNASDAQIQRAHTPYTVTEQNFSIRSLQPRDANRHAVFFTNAREAISYHYERNPADPRIQHALTLEVDAFGNVLKQAAIGYGRRTSPLSTQWDRDRQTTALLTYTENRVTKDHDTGSDAIDGDDDYRTPIPCEAVTFELTGYTATGSAGRYQASDFVEAAPGLPGRLRHKFTAPDVAYEATATGNRRRRPIEWLRTLYRRDDLSGLLPLGDLQSLAVPGESYKLAFTPELLTQVFQRPRAGQSPEPLLPNPMRATVLGGTAGDQGGYVDLDSNGHWWVPSGRSFFTTNPAHDAATELNQARQHFFLPRRYRDPFGHDAFVEFDTPYDLLMVETRDALGNRVTVDANDYRVLQPRLVSDPNRNQTEVTFDTLGMVVGAAVMGKALPAPVEGDSLGGFVADLTQSQIDGFHDAADPHATAPALLQNATTRIVYDLDRFRRTQQANPNDPTQWQPVCAATLARETHVSAPLPPQGLKIQLSFSYSDGFGREIQKKIQAEPGPLVKGGPNVSPRWVGSGWTIFNNKGKPVRQYEPFFSKRQRPDGSLFSNHRFEFGTMVGVSPVLFYDPAERVVATLHPNHTWEKVVFNPWQQTTYDVNDTVLVADPKTDPDVGDFFRRLPNAEYLPTWHALRTDAANAAAFAALYPDATDRTNETRAAEKTRVHAATPTVAHADSLGRTFLTVAHNKFKYSNTPAAAPPVEEFHSTRIVLDIEGNQREVIDAKDRIVMRYAYDMLGNRIHQASMEAGARWMLNDVAGKPIRAWDSRGFMRRMTYDELRRPTGLFVTENGTERLAERTRYGEGQGRANNHKTRVFQIFDGAGRVTSEAYDFKGNLLRSARTVADNYKKRYNWQTDTVQPTWEIFSSSTNYDALNRLTAVTAPDNSVYRPTYNDANLLDKVDVSLRGAAAPTSFVTSIDYDAKGQRTKIEYGNGAITTYEYDPLTFRLRNLRTTRTGFPGNERVAQDLRYTYDPVGNITHIQDDADIQNVVFFNNSRVDPSANYRYDAIYRLIEADGREHIGQATQPETSWDDTGRVKLAHPHDGQAMRQYVERYLYDEVGNIDELVHLNGTLAAPGAPIWRRRYTYNEDSLIEDGALGNPLRKSNRLSQTIIGRPVPGTLAPESYPHDRHGNITRMPHLQTMEWDFKDQLGHIRQGTMQAYYVYDASGQRVRKVTEDAGTKKNERIYLSGFELYREHTGTNAGLVRETLHIMDDTQRIALVETRNNIDDGSPTQLLRFQFSNHLGTATLELNQQARVISYEEYSPYGSTTYQAVDKVIRAPAKRYRYTGKERDEESGLYYHGARYYAAWLGRWTRYDPLYLKDAKNVYIYVLNNPIIATDPTGGPVWLIPVVIYLGWRALESAAETGVEAGIAKATDDRDFSVGGTFVKNMAVNTVVGLIPGAVEAKLTAKVAIYGAKLAIRTTGDATYDTLRGKGTPGENLVKSGVGNVGGDLLAKGVSKVGGAILKRFRNSADEVTEAASKSIPSTPAKPTVEAAKPVSEGIEKSEKAVADAAAPQASPSSETFEKLIDNDAFSASPAVIDRLSRARQFDIGGYKSLTAKGEYGRVGDNLDSDEALQNAFVRAQKGVDRYDKLLEGNPAIALDPSLHRQVSNLRTPQLQGMSAAQALDWHINQLRAFTPDYVWRTLERESQRYIAGNAL